MTKNDSALHESMQTRTLANGLRICYLPKEGFSKTFAILATDFGSVDASFTFEGKRYDTPAGVAHFLEHKMFEDEDGNALQKFRPHRCKPERLHEPHHDGVSLFPAPTGLRRIWRFCLNSCSRRTSRMKTWRRNAALSIRRSAW